MSQPYQSGRQQNLNLGITSVTESRTVLQTIGKVGIGTTNAQQHSLFVVGSTNITGDVYVGGASTFVGVGTFRDSLYIANQLYVGGVNVSGGASIGQDITTRNFLASGISTFNGLIDANNDLDVDGHTELDNVNVSGIITATSLDVLTNFDVYDTQAVFHNNVRIDGNLSIGGTATAIFAQDLRVFDKEITLGITTDAFGNDISNDTTANHGGISIASTVGSPLVDLALAGFSTLPPTYKQLMWVAANSYGIGTTDAWLFNYAVGIGSTLVPNGVRFAVKEIQFTDNTVTSPNVTSTNLSVTGLSTLGIATASQLAISGVSTFTGLVDANGGATIDNIRIGIANDNTIDTSIGNLILDSNAGTISITDQLSVTGISTFNLDVDVDRDLNVDRNLTVTGLSTFSGLLDANGGASIDNVRIGVIGDNTIDTSTGDLTLDSAGGTIVINDQLNVSGVSTFQNNVDLGNNDVIRLGNSGEFQIARYGSPNSDIASIFASGLNLTIQSSGTTIRDNGGNAVADFHVSSGVARLYQAGSVKLQTIGSGVTITGTNFADQLSISGVSTLAANGGITTTGGDLYVGGDLYIKDDLVFDEFTARNANVTGITTLNVTSATDLYVTGLSTFVGVATAQSTLFANQLSVSGFSTLTNLKVSGITPNGTDFGGSQYLLRATGTGGWEWANVPGIFSVNNILNGFNVSDEGLIVGTAGSITQLDFRGNNIIASADPQPNGIATIRVSDTPSFDSLNVSGLSTFAGITTVTGDTLFAKQLNVSGLSTFVGVGTFQSDLYVGGNLFIQNDLVFDEATLRNINITGISTLGIATATQLSVAGVTTTGNLTVNGTSLFIGGIQANSVIFANGGVTGNLTGNVTSTGSNTFGQAVVAGIITARQFVGDVQSGVATITTGLITNVSGSTLNYTGLSTIRDISAAGINVTGVVTARQFVGDINAGVATITTGLITNASGSTLNYTGLSTITDISASGVNVSGVVTARQFVGDINAGFATITQASVSGVITARQFVGDVNAGVATITTGLITNASGSTLNYTGLSTITDITAAGIRVSGVVTARQFVGDINAGVATVTTLFGTNATFSGNVSIAGTLTYEDVTNVDSIGVITARSDVTIGGNLSSVGITTLASAGGITTTGGDLFVGDDIFFKGNLYQNGRLFAAGIGIGSTAVNPGSGFVNQRVGTGFTDLNIVGTGISVTGYGSTVVIDFGNIAAASGGALSISTVFSPRIQDVSFVGGATTSIIGISTQTDRFVYDTQTGSVGIGTSSSSIPQYKLDVVGDINSSTSVKIKGVDVLEEAVRLAIAFG